MTIGGSTIVNMNQAGCISTIIHDDLFKLKKGESIRKFCEKDGIADEIMDALDQMDDKCQLIIGKEQKYVLSGRKKKSDYQITLIELTEDLLNHDEHLKRELEDTKRQLEDVKHTLYDNLETLGTYAIKDMLTGAYNRAYLNTKYQEVSVMQKRKNMDIAFVYIDLNQFKLVNANFGLVEGDRLLKKFTDIATASTRLDFDFIFRVGADDFVMIMVECNYEDALNVCDRLNDAFKMHTVVSSLAYGVVMVEEGMPLDECLEYSEKKMELFKQRYLKHEHLGDAN
jgi:diguanylate cyclase (GGDEF)-like protein